MDAILKWSLPENMFFRRLKAICGPIEGTQVHKPFWPLDWIGLGTAPSRAKIRCPPLLVGSLPLLLKVEAHLDTLKHVNILFEIV